MGEGLYQIFFKRQLPFDVASAVMEYGYILSTLLEEREDKDDEVLEEEASDDGSAEELPDDLSSSETSVDHETDNVPSETAVKNSAESDLPVQSSDPAEIALKEVSEETPPDPTEEELYTLVLEGFQVTHELMVVQIGLMVMLFAMFVFRFVYRLISNMVTKF